MYFRSTSFLQSTGIVWSMCLMIFAPFARTEPASLDTKPYRFDAGRIVADDRMNVTGITAVDMYDPERGYGWIASPEDDFVRKDLDRSRDAFTIDGVRGEQISFRADLPSGDWWATFWIEAGTEDSSTLSLSINDQYQQLNWHAFRPPAEPRTSIQDMYRLYHTHVKLEENGFEFHIAGEHDQVRILGFTMTPDSTPLGKHHQSILKQIGEAGVYGSTVSLDSLLMDVEILLAKNPADAFASYWREQLQLLRLAEQYMNMMGWEWATRETGLSIFGRFHQAVMILDGLLQRANRNTYPLYERALWYRGKLLYWLAKERGGRNEIFGGKRDLSELHRRYPDNLLLAMYNGVKVNRPDPCDSLEQTPNAPAWSVHQREAVCRLRHIAHWWVNERQAENGEFGGKLGDDVELLRWWTSIILAGDETALEGWRRLADCVWKSPKVHKGYAKYASDVEHASEFIADTAPCMAIYDDDSLYTERLRNSLEYFETLWTDLTPAGNRFFRSAWFSSTEVGSEPPKNRDVGYNTRAVKAVRYLAWKTGDTRAIRLLHEWSRAWVSVAMRTDKGKPQGIIPASVRFPDEAINGDEPTWYIADMYWIYYDWIWHAGSMIMDQLLFTYTLTGDEELLRPIYAALDLVRTYEGKATSFDNTKTASPGSPAWAAAVLKQNNGFWSVASQWRVLTDDGRYDDLFLDYGTPYVRYRLTGDDGYLLDGLDSLLASVRYNVPLLTSEVLHTDRVNVFGAEHLKGMISGDGIPESMSPYFSVSWEGTDDTFTALVTETGKDKLGVQLFSHAGDDREVTMRLWQVKPGTYTLQCSTDEKIIDETTIHVSERGQRISLKIPQQELVTVILEETND